MIPIRRYLKFFSVVCSEEASAQILAPDFFQANPGCPLDLFWKFSLSSPLEVQSYEELSKYSKLNLQYHMDLYEDLFYSPSGISLMEPAESCHLGPRVIASSKLLPDPLWHFSKNVLQILTNDSSQMQSTSQMNLLKFPKTFSLNNPLNSGLLACLRETPRSQGHNFFQTASEYNLVQASIRPIWTSYNTQTTLKALFTILSKTRNNVLHRLHTPRAHRMFVNTH